MMPTADELRLRIAEAEQDHADIELWLVFTDATLAALAAIDLPTQREALQQLGTAATRARFLIDQMAGCIDDLRALLADIDG